MNSQHTLKSATPPAQKYCHKHLFYKTPLLPQLCIRIYCVNHFSENTMSVPASWPSCQPAHACVFHFLHVWPAVLEAGLQPSCDAVQILLCLVSESLAQSAGLSAHSPGPAWLSPLTPCSVGEAHMRHVTGGVQMFVQQWDLSLLIIPFITFLACSSCSLSCSKAWLCFCLMSAICCSWTFASSSSVFFNCATSVSRFVLNVNKWLDARWKSYWAVVYIGIKA